MATGYEFWQAALKGSPPELTVGKAECGFYRMQTREGWQPVAIWPDQADPNVRFSKIGKGDTKVADDVFCERVFSYCSRFPIREEVYRDVMAGKPWPDEPPPKPERPPGSNLGPEGSYEALREEYLGEKAEIEAWLKTDPIKDQEACDRAANWAARIIDLEKRAETARKREKQPFLDEARAVDDQWMPVVAGAAALKRALKDAQTPYLKALAEKQKQERAKAAAAAAPAVERPRNAKAGTVGSRTSLRTVRYGEITDAAAFAAYLIEIKNPDMMSMLQTIADRIAHAKATAPGMKITEDSRAA